jgi:predicted DCC family thiol-disulfide oxidoreductase YuxK
LIKSRAYPENPGQSEPEGWVLYDGACGFCSRWVPFWESTLKKRGFHIAPVQSDWVVEKLNLSQEELVSDFRLLLRSGAQFRGAEAYRCLMRRIWWAMPLYILSTLPMFRSLFDAAYRKFAANRYCVSRACRLPATHRAGRKMPH